MLHVVVDDLAETESQIGEDKAADLKAVAASLAKPNYLLKIIPHVDGSPRILELVDYRLEDVTVKGAWTGPAALDLRPHALAPIADLPVREIISATHIGMEIRPFPSASNAGGLSLH